MLIVDANVLLYAVNDDVPQHGAAQRWLDGALSGGETVGFTWVVICAFLRISTRAGIFPAPLSFDQAVAQVRAWLGAPGARVVEPTAQHLDVLSVLLGQLGSAGNLVNDAHLAAVAIEHRGELVSFDADFARFPGLRWRRPDQLVDGPRD